MRRTRDYVLGSILVWCWACGTTTTDVDAGADASHESGMTDAAEEASIPCDAQGTCGFGQQCFFPIDAGCSPSIGRCMVPSGGCKPGTACGCDGTDIGICGQGDYTNAQYQYFGSCDAGSSD